MSVWLTHEELAAVEAAAADRGLKRNSMIRQMIQDWLAEYDSFRLAKTR